MIFQFKPGGMSADTIKAGITVLLEIQPVTSLNKTKTVGITTHTWIKGVTKRVLIAELEYYSASSVKRLYVNNGSNHKESETIEMLIKVVESWL
jgi:hypothetical protein